MTRLPAEVAAATACASRAALGWSSSGVAAALNCTAAETDCIGPDGATGTNTAAPNTDAPMAAVDSARSDRPNDTVLHLYCWTLLAIARHGWEFAESIRPNLRNGIVAARRVLLPAMRATGTTVGFMPVAGAPDSQTHR